MIPASYVSRLWGQSANVLYWPFWQYSSVSARIRIIDSEASLEMKTSEKAEQERAFLAD
jgi:hypothetical protein